MKKAATSFQPAMRNLSRPASRPTFTTLSRDQTRAAEDEAHEAVLGDLVRLLVEVFVARAVLERRRGQQRRRVRLLGGDAVGAAQQVERHVAATAEHARVVVDGRAARRRRRQRPDQSVRRVIVVRRLGPVADVQLGEAVRRALLVGFFGALADRLQDRAGVELLVVLDVARFLIIDDDAPALLLVLRQDDAEHALVVERSILLEEAIGVRHAEEDVAGRQLKLHLVTEVERLRTELPVVRRFRRRRRRRAAAAGPRTRAREDKTIENPSTRVSFMRRLPCKAKGRFSHARANCSIGFAVSDLCHFAEVSRPCAAARAARAAWPWRAPRAGARARARCRTSRRSP